MLYSTLRYILSVCIVPFERRFVFFSISNNDYNTVGKLIKIINVNDSATVCCRNRVSLYVRVCKQNSWRNMTDFDKFHWMDCLQNYHWFGLICISNSSGPGFLFSWRRHALYNQCLSNCMCALVNIQTYSNVQLRLSLNWRPLFPTHRQVSPRWKLELLNWRLTYEATFRPVNSKSWSQF